MPLWQTLYQNNNNQNQADNSSNRPQNSLPLHAEAQLYGDAHLGQNPTHSRKEVRHCICDAHYWNNGLWCYRIWEAHLQHQPLPAHLVTLRLAYARKVVCEIRVGSAVHAQYY